MENKELELCPGHSREVCAMCCWPKQMEVSGKSLEAMYFENQRRAAAYWRERIYPNIRAENKEFEAAIRDAVITGTGAFMIGGVKNTIEIKHIDNGSGQMFYDPKAVEWQEPEPQTQYTAVDMATAAAEGFRDGAKSVVVTLPDLAGPTKAFNDESMDSGFDEAIEQCREAIIAAGGSVKE